MRQLFAALAVLVVVGFSRTASADYSHYWTWLKPPDQARVAACLDEMEKVARARPDLVADIDGAAGPAAKFRVTLPHTSYFDGGPRRDAIVFNGIAPDAYEAFNFPGGPGFNFTRTVGKPYDAVVTAALIVARTCFTTDELQIESDGKWDRWSEGRKLYTTTFGKEPPNALLDDGTTNAPAEPKSWFLIGGLIAVGVIAWLLARRRTD